jgi:hypothetical protein
MSRWFRFYDDAVNDPKVQRLSGDKFKTWVNLLCLASKNNGVLPALADISFTLRIGQDKVAALLNEFCAAGLLDPVEVDGAPMSYEPHNWGGRQFKSDVSNDRVKRYRQRKRNVTPTVTVTTPETETETDTETEQKKDAAPAGAQVVPLPPNPEKIFFDQAAHYLGNGGRSLAGALLKSKGGNVPAAHSALLTAVQKSNPREYLGAIIRGREQAECRPDRSF